MTISFLPIIDFGPFLDPNITEQDRFSIAKQIDAACRQYGYVTASLNKHAANHTCQLLLLD
jgi:isopenicillin N synthase-like dioxygenase